MFGYVRALESELLVREFELYKSFYCGLCKTMGKKISPLSRLALNYDMVFLALLRTAITGEKIENFYFRCKLKPSKKRNYIKTNETLIYCSCVFAVLSYYKFADDINDEKNKLKKFFLKICFPVKLFLAHIKKKAGKYYPGLENQIHQPLLKLAELEKNGCDSIDCAASCFAKLMQNAASFGLEDPGQIKTAGNIGWHLGRWLYIIDALDDFEKDIKKGGYNPFISYYGDKKAMIDDVDMIKYSLASSLGEMNSNFLNAGDSCVNPIVLNIINLGLCSRQEKIIKKLK